jgi:hypothetical protein
LKLELSYAERRRWSWTEKRQQQAADVIDIVNALMDYRPPQAGGRPDAAPFVNRRSSLSGGLATVKKGPWAIDDKAKVIRHT